MADNSNASTLATLEDGIKRGDTVIKKLSLRRPGAGELRGLSLQDLLRADVGAIIAVLPRISDPTITVQEAEQLTPPDLAECAGAVAGFFLTSAQRATLNAMTSTS